MKKIYTMLMMAMMALVFTSCEDDEAIAYTLEGTWKGNMHIVSDDWYGEYYTSTYSEVTFLRDPYTYSSGNGYWVDHYSNAPWDYVANHIEWTVDYGTIHIYFVEERTSMEIYDYRLSMISSTGRSMTGTTMWSLASLMSHLLTGATIAGAMTVGPTAIGAAPAPPTRIASNRQESRIDSSILRSNSGMADYKT